MKKALGKLYVQVLLAVIVGSLVGVLFPEKGCRAETSG